VNSSSKGSLTAGNVAQMQSPLPWEGLTDVRDLRMLTKIEPLTRYERHNESPMPTLPPDALHLLAVHADTHEPLLSESLDVRAADWAAAPTDTVFPEFLKSVSGDRNDLRLQKWSLIVPKGAAGDRLLELVRPLITYRQEDLGAAPQIYQVPPQMTVEDSLRWKREVYEPGDTLPDGIPLYQLILGDLDQVSLALQQVQSHDGHVGRLAFRREDHYEAYVEKLIRNERAPAAASKGRALFHTVRDGTMATELGHRTLIEPGLAMARESMDYGRFPAKEIIESGAPFHPSPDELLRLTSQGEPAVLFTLSHGEGSPKGGWASSHEQRARQGAMSFGRNSRLGAEDIANRSFLSGGVWFMFACFGAGTPDDSAYYHWLENLQKVGRYQGQLDAILASLPRGDDRRPFIAALPQAALANPNGPVAFIGHVDLAWSYSFQEIRERVRKHPARFISVIQNLLKHDRVGTAFMDLLRYRDAVNSELAALYDGAAAQRAFDPTSPAAQTHRSHLWMLRQDLAGYIILGDPAARLALATNSSLRESQ